MPRAEFEIIPPYNFELSLSFSHDCRFEQNPDISALHRFLAIDGIAVLMKIACRGKINSPHGIVNWLYPDGGKISRDEIINKARHIIGADVDLRPFYQLARKDKRLKRLIDKFRGLKPVLTSTVFESAAWAIVGQQVTMTFAATLRNRLVKKYGKIYSENGISMEMFPEPDRFGRVKIDHLKKLQFSGRKAEYLLGLSDLIRSGRFDIESLGGLPYHEAVDRLMSVRGIGPWSANYILMRGAGHLNCLPVGDSGLHRAVREFYQLNEAPAIRTIEKTAEPFEPFRSLFTLYMWHYLLQGDKL